jgi:general L-amino acid transport system substrate-binding protein
MKNICWIAVLLCLISATLSSASIKDEVEKRGFVQCGVTTGLPGFSNPDVKGNWSGLNVDICRAVGVAVLGDAAKVKFIPVTEKGRFTSLASGEVDVLLGSIAWTLTHDTALGLRFVGVSYFDGQGFLVAKKFGAKNSLGLSGAAVCIQTEGLVESNLAGYFKQNKMEYKPVFSDTFEQAIKNFEAGRCEVLVHDQSKLLAQRIRLNNAPETIILPELISKKPFGPVVRQGDQVWFNIVRWALYAMINGEELGITSKNIEEIKKSRDPDILRFIGKEGAKGASLGLHDDWALQIIRQVGNYGESFDRNLGQGSLLRGERGLNALWNQGGILFAPPFR